MCGPITNNPVSAKINLLLVYHMWWFECMQHSDEEEENRFKKKT